MVKRHRLDLPPIRGRRRSFCADIITGLLAILALLALTAGYLFWTWLQVLG